MARRPNAVIVNLTHHDHKTRNGDPHRRGLEAAKLSAAGLSWDEIADRLGYSGAQYAAAASARATGQRSSRRATPYVRQPRVAS